jgi:hypothetical protein
MNTSPKALTVPDSKALSHVQKLCDISDPYNSSATTDLLFMSAMKEIITWHCEKSPFYKKLMADQGFTIEALKTLDDCSKIPFVPANFFKLHEVVSIPKDSVSLHLTSSGTTGQKSQMFFDEWSIGSAQRMVDYIFDAYDWTTPSKPANYILYSYQQTMDSKLGTAFTDNYLCKYAPINQVFTTLRLTGNGGHEFDVFGTMEALKKFSEEKLPVRIFGFPAFLYFTLERMKLLKMAPLNFPEDSLIFLGGGWKGHADKAIKKTDLYHLVTEMLGIPDERIRDGFGSVEHCVPYVECRNHQFHVPIWSRVIIRDVRTLKPLPYRQQGFLGFVSPYITSVPAHSVLMGDLASLYPAEDCNCGLSTPYFVVHGRAGTSKNKSCAVAAAEMLKKES